MPKLQDNDNAAAYAITPLDGRNRHKIEKLSACFSDFALNKFRVFIELEYFKALSKYKIIRKFSDREYALIAKIAEVFSAADYGRVRSIEKTVNHDVKAIEEFIKEKLAATSLKDTASMVHFGVTSDDTNNLAYGLMLKNIGVNIFLPELEKVSVQIGKMAAAYKDLAMLGRTHGQPAVATTVGKELAVFHKRLNKEIDALAKIKIEGKLTGNVGNLNSHKFIYPGIDWLKFSREFVVALGLVPNLHTTQILPYDSYILFFQTLIRINGLLEGLSKDMWLYIMQGYFGQKLVAAEVGSTALPHKINPIYFEGAEGGFGIANSLLEFYCRKLSYSRLQRDLSDSTVKRSFGIAFGYCLLSYQSVLEGSRRISPVKEELKKDLYGHPEILSEAVQNYLRVKGFADAYDKAKKFFRGRKIIMEDYWKFVNSLELDDKDKVKLLELEPGKYTGYAEELATQ